MIRQLKSRIVVTTDARDGDDWCLRLRTRLLVLSAAAGNPDNGPAVQQAVAAEIDHVIEMLPDEQQMTAALKATPRG